MGNFYLQKNSILVQISISQKNSVTSGVYDKVFKTQFPTTNRKTVGY